MYLLVASSEERQLELYVGLKEASKCQELVELERGRAGPRERERERSLVEFLAMDIAWEDHDGLWR